MATPISELLVKISADSSGLKEGLDKAKGGLGEFVMEAGLATAAVAAFSKIMGDSIGFYKRQEDALVRLDAVYKSTGGAVGIAQDELIAFSGELQKMTRHGDESIQEMMAIMLTFKGVTGDAFKRATEAALDLSAVMGGDAKGAALQLGKALEDPITGLTALRRSGVSFTESEKERIKTLVESNRLHEAQAIILDAVEGQVGGTARAMRETLAGASEAASNAMGDFGEKLGSQVAPALKAIAVATENFAIFMQSVPDPVLKAGIAVGGVATALMAAIPALKLFGITLNTSLLGPIGLVTASLTILSLEVLNLMDQFDKQKARVSTFKEIDERIKSNTASLSDYQKQIGLLGADIRKFEDAQRSSNPIDIALNASGALSVKIKEYTQRQKELMIVETGLRRRQEENGKASIALARKEADEKMRLLTAEQKAAEKAYAETLTLEQAKSEGVLDLYLQTNAWKKKIDDEYSESLAWNLDTQQAYHEKRTDEVLANELYSIEIQLAAEDARIAKEKKLLEESVADKKKAHDKYYSDLETASSGTFRILGALNDAFDLGIGETLKNLDTLSGGIIEVFKSGGTSVGGWLDTAVGAIGLIGQAWDVFSGEKARKDEEARAKEIKAFEDIAEARLDSTIEGLERERAEKISQAIAIGAQTRDIEIYYARAVARARITANESVLAEKAKVEAEAGRITKYWSDKAVTDAKAFTSKVESNIRNDSSLGREQKTWALASLGSVYDNYLKYFQGIYTQSSKAALEAMEMSFALFGDRATEASKGLASAMVGGFQSGESEADIKSAIFDMLQNMAIEAAIMAAGIGDKFEVIGAQIAEALRDGFMDSSELSGIEAEINKLYESASKTVSSVAGIFNKTGGISNDGSGGSIPYGDASKYSAASLSGGPVFNFNSPIALNPSQTEAMFTVTARQLAFQGVL